MLVVLCLLLQTAAPRLISRVPPEYSEEARRARLNGSVIVGVVVQPDGMPGDLRVIRPLGLGVDEKALDAVSRWRFQPGLKDGQAVPVKATVEVSFRLMVKGWYTRGLVFHTPEGAVRPALVRSRFMAEGEQEEGSVTLAFLVDEDGRAAVPRVEKSSAASLEREALGMLRGWEFQPGMQNGKPIAVRATLELVFGST